MDKKFDTDNPSPNLSQDNLLALDSSAIPLEGAFVMPIDSISPMSGQPRQRFDEIELQKLADNIRRLKDEGLGCGKTGILMPLIVRSSKAKPQSFIITSGERRYRAAQIAGCSFVPVVIQNTNDEQAFEESLIENTHREDIDIIEKGEAYITLRELIQKRLNEWIAATFPKAKGKLSVDQINLLIDNYADEAPWARDVLEHAKEMKRNPKATWEIVSQRVDVSPRRILQCVATTELPADIRELIQNGSLQERQARLITGLKDATQQRQLAHEVVDKGLNEKETKRRKREIEAVGVNKRLYGSPLNLQQPSSSTQTTTDEHTLGPLMHLEGLRHEPINELGVVFLFGMFAERLGFAVEGVRAPFPDCIAKRQIDPKKDRWSSKPVRIEFEYKSRNLIPHKHDLEKVDLVVCWEHTWPECPVEVLELKSEIKKLKPNA